MTYAPLCLECLSRICHHVLPQGKPKRLSPLEVRVLLASVNGLGEKDTAAALRLGTATIKSYRNRIRAKLGIGTWLEAVLWARDHVDLLSGIPRAAPLSQPSEAPEIRKVADNTVDEHPYLLHPAPHDPPSRRLA